MTHTKAYEPAIESGPIFDTNPTYKIELNPGVKPEDIVITLGFNMTKGVSVDKDDSTYRHRKILLERETDQDGLCVVTLILTDCPRVGVENYHLLEEQLAQYGAVQSASR